MGAARVAPNVLPNGREMESEMVEATRETFRGKAVDFYDPRGRKYDALVTEVWGPQCVNVVFVNDVEGQKDNYGQKLMRATSLMHGSAQQAHGNYWLERGEKPFPHNMPGFYEGRSTFQAELDEDSASH